MKTDYDVDKEKTRGLKVDHLGPRRFGIQLSALVMALLFAGTALTSPKKARHHPKVPSPFRGSLLEYRNTVSVRTFNKDADLTHNPYFAMELHGLWAYALGSHLRLTLDVLIGREFTHSDTATKRGEVYLNDIFLKFIGLKVPKLPVVGVAVEPSLRWVLPTSKASKARTLLLGIRPGLLLSKRFKVFNGLTLSYLFEVQKNWHDSTTMQSHSPRIGLRPGSIGGFAFSNMGERNVSVALINGFFIQLRFKKRYEALLAMKIAHQYLYNRNSEDERISYSAVPDTHMRYLMAYTGELTYRLYFGVRLALGFLTENFQLADNAAYEMPFFNRHTALFFDVRFNLPNFASRISSRGKK